VRSVAKNFRRNLASGDRARWKRKREH